MLHMNPSQKFLAKLGLKEPDTTEEANSKYPEQENSRRSFFKKSAMGGLALGSSFMFSPIEDVVAQSTSKVNRNSAPSDLKITDMRYCVVQNVGRTPLIRIDTNQ